MVLNATFNNRPVPIIKKADVSYLTCSESDIVHPNEDLGM